MGQESKLSRINCVEGQRSEARAASADLQERNSTTAKVLKFIWEKSENLITQHFLKPPLMDTGTCRKWEGGQLFGYCWKWKQETSEKGRRGETSKFRQKPFLLSVFFFLFFFFLGVFFFRPPLFLWLSRPLPFPPLLGAVDLSTSACQSGGRGGGQVGLPSLGNRTLYFPSRNPRPLPPLLRTNALSIIHGRHCVITSVRTATQE